MREWQRVAVDHRDDGVFTGILPGMPAAAGDAAAEKQFALGAVEHHVSGGFGSEALGFFAIADER